MTKEESKRIEASNPEKLANEILDMLNSEAESESREINNDQRKFLQDALNLIEPYPIKISTLEEDGKIILQTYGIDTYKKSTVIPETKFSKKKLFNAFYQWITGRFTLLTAGALIILFSFKGKVLYPIINKLIELSFFVKIEKDDIEKFDFTLLSIFTGVLLSIYWSKKIWDKARISKWVNFLSLFLTGYYAYFKCFDDKYIFLPVENTFKYLDFIFFNLLFILIAYFFHNRYILKYRLKHSKEKEDSKSVCDLLEKDLKDYWNSFKIIENEGVPDSTPLFLEDTPIKNKQEDKYNRSRFAKELAERIITTSTENSYAISIQDAWGNGKTSFMKLLENECKAYEDTITLWFNPWLAENKKLLITDFFNVLNQKTDIYDAKLGKQILLYAKKLNAITKSNYTAILESAFNLSNTSTLYEHYEQINQRIAQLGKKIIIFIDDLDRLDNEEIIETLRIIRNTSNFNNTFFVVANDKAIGVTQSHR